MQSTRDLTVRTHPWRSQKVLDLDVQCQVVEALLRASQSLGSLTTLVLIPSFPEKQQLHSALSVDVQGNVCQHAEISTRSNRTNRVLHDL